MRRHLPALFACALLCLMVLPSTVSADGGLKLAVTITVVNTPAGEYHLDLLVIGPDDHTNIDPADYDLSLLQRLRDQEVDSRYPTLAGDTSVPLFGDPRPGEDDTRRFAYYGLLRALHVAISGSGGIQVADESFTRTVFYTHLTYDWEANSIIRAISPTGFYGIQLLSTLVPTLLVEGGLLQLSDFRARRDQLVSLAVNLVTQAGSHLWIAADLVSIGDSAPQYLMPFVVEVPILLVELIACVFLLKGYSGLRRAAYAVCANTISYAVGYLLLR